MIYKRNTKKVASILLEQVQSTVFMETGQRSPYGVCHKQYYKETQQLQVSLTVGSRGHKSGVGFLQNSNNSLA